MFPPAAMSNHSASLSEEASVVPSVTRVQDFRALNPAVSTISIPQPPQKMKKKRSLPGHPDPDAEVIALSPRTLLATNRFVCEICSKGFQRDQNLQLHKRGHNLPWKLKQRSSKDVRKRAYVCPEVSCVHHHPSRALGDLTGIKKHYCRKHGEKKWKCSKCSKIYAVQSDWRAHTKTCGTREYRCDCGSLFSRKDSFITHRAFCDALAEESARFSANQLAAAAANGGQTLHLQPQTTHSSSLFPFTTTHIGGGLSPWEPSHQNPNPNNPLHIKPETEKNRHHFQIPPPLSSSSSFSSQYNNNFQEPQPTTRPAFQSRLHVVSSTQPTFNVATSAYHSLSATALLQKAATVGAASSRQAQSMTTGPMRTMTQLNMGELAQIDSASHISPGTYMGFTPANLSAWQKSDRLTRDFLGMAADANGNENVSGGAINVSVNVRDVLTYTGGLEFQPYERSVLKPQSFGFAEPTSGTWGDC